MAMTKAEMELARANYFARLSDARLALQTGLYAIAIQHAVSSLEFVDGMMQFERKYEKREFKSIETIDIVLRYAPLIFDYQSLDALDSLLRSQKRIDKNASADLAAMLARARQLMWDAHRFWDLLEQSREFRQDEARKTLGGDQDCWRWLAESWEAMGYLRRTPEGGSYRLALITRMDDAVMARCPECGATGRAPKSKVLYEINCPKCRARVCFVILSKELTALS
jgi:hypothetical protein